MNNQVRFGDLSGCMCVCERKYYAECSVKSSPYFLFTARDYQGQILSFRPRNLPDFDFLPPAARHLKGLAGNTGGHQVRLIGLSAYF